MALASANGRHPSYNNNPPDLKFQLNYLQSYQVHVTKINLCLVKRKFILQSSKIRNDIYCTYN